MKKIIINSKKHGHQEILVDDEDYDYLMQWKWHVYKGPRTFYVLRQTRLSEGFNPPKTIYLSRVVTNENDSKIVIDHIDRNGLNNQKSNLRRATKADNRNNTAPRTNSSSKFLGVCVKKDRGRKYWYAQTRKGPEKFYLGLFPFTEEGEIAAAKAYDKKAKELFGEFAYLNFEK